MSTTALVWFRRDLRGHDHPGLTAAHRECDRRVEEALPDGVDVRRQPGVFVADIGSVRPYTRDFYAHVLLNHPGNAHHAHRREFDRLEWDDDVDLLDVWREGRTGFPVVDAAMRQLLATGWMHNRGRLIAGSFLTKDLHLDWRHGEAHFMRHLLCGLERERAMARYGAVGAGR